uniref:Transmembrane protein n=1 Tax=Medicago truncatula TaxID=3880 RepID=I3SNW5_MEDTR|nr:unknown [Medicago truncatula]
MNFFKMNITGRHLISFMWMLIRITTLTITRGWLSLLKLEDWLHMATPYGVVLLRFHQMHR